MSTNCFTPQQLFLTIKYNDFINDTSHKGQLAIKSAENKTDQYFIILNLWHLQTKLAIMNCSTRK